MINSLLQVALGGAVGSVLRFLSLQVFPAPWGTLAVNVVGSFLIGLLWIPAGRLGVSALVVTGILGGFTTLSAFSLDAARLWSGALPWRALAYVGASVILSLVAVGLGSGLFHALQNRWASS